MKMSKSAVALCVFGVLGASSAYAEKGDTITQVQQVVEFDDMSKEAIYNGARQWVATVFTSAQSVIQMEDKEAGIIIGKGNMKFSCTGSWLCTGYDNSTVRFTLKIETKDGRARVTFDDIRGYSPSSYSAGIHMPEMEFPIVNRTKKLDIVGQTRAEFEKQIDKFKNAVVVTKPANDNW